jgi:DNA-binding NtrC family response regulator
LIETELFGHEKGAFTGAAARRIGKFEEADGGTLFLDEIGEMDINFQAKLLRAVQEKEIYRVGSNSPVKTNCRIIVATNKNLSEEVKQGKFRQDLYYRFFGLPIVLPPLRQRGKDIVLLANHFIDSFCEANNLPSKSLTSDAKTKLMNHSFPGNVRELKSVVELAAVMASDSEITASDITLDTQDALPDLMTQNLSLREYNQKIVNHYMDKFNGNTKQVAEALCIGQTTVYRLLNEQKEPI